MRGLRARFPGAEWVYLPTVLGGNPQDLRLANGARAQFLLRVR